MATLPPWLLSAGVAFLNDNATPCEAKTVPVFSVMGLVCSIGALFTLACAAAALSKDAAKSSSTTFAVVYALRQDLVFEVFFLSSVTFATPTAQKNSAVPAMYSAALHCAEK
jgi:hypothetical protein